MPGRERFEIRLSDALREQWDKAAARQGLTLTDWLKRAANERAALEKVLSDMEEDRGVERAVSDVHVSGAPGTHRATDIRTSSSSAPGD
jgi:hypothetical protein